MRYSRRLFLTCAATAGAIASQSAFAVLEGYWPVTETTGTTTANAAGGTPGALNGNAAFATDPQRGQVLQFSGAGFVNAGFAPQLTATNDVTYSFWALNQTDPVASPNVVIVGNRYLDTTATDFTPREFTKFTPTQFEYHHDGIGENANYPDLTNPSPWTHLSVVKQGNHLISYQDGLVQGVTRITLGQNNPQPFFFGGNGTLETWTGRLDDVAVWSNALPTSTVSGLAKGTFTPANAPTTQATAPTVFSDNFSSGLAKWTATNRGLEGNAPTGYNAPDASGLAVSLSGTTTTAATEFWRGNSIESNTRFSSSLETTVTVDRVSLTGTGTAFRSSLWVLGNDGHYLHFAQDRNETGWEWNARDDGGIGTLNPTGSGNNIVELDSLDADAGLHSMRIQVVPTGTAGSVNMFMFLDNTVVAARAFTNFPSDFAVVLTGQARTNGDSVNAIFDNVVVQQVPEPTAATLLLLGGLVAGVRRRR